MKDIHPVYFPDAKIVCACGTEYRLGSTVKEMRVELCANCHPYYTGTAKFVDTAGRIEKFKARLSKVRK
jgi:large subunit ribosomal protein L31